MTATVFAKGLRAGLLTATCLLPMACATDPTLSGRDGEAEVPATDTAAVAVQQNHHRSKAIASYRDYLARYPDSAEYDDVARRLADLLVEQAADLQLAKAQSPEDAAELQAQALQAYAAAISHYEYLLEKDPQRTESSALLYQLARAYEESGQSQPALASIDRLLKRELTGDTRLYADTRFRQGELLFAQGDYVEAGRAYQAVVDLGTSVPAYEQSLYKLGWSLFKEEQYRAALPVLFASLDQKIAPNQDYTTQLQGLSQADREQVADLLRVISRTFAQLGGVDAVDHYFMQGDKHTYEEQIYLELADWYVEQDQVSEAASTWLALAQTAPLSAQAPRLTAKAINLYQQAGFQQRGTELRAHFVLTYGMDSDFWRIHSPADFPDVVAELQSSLQALARLNHNQAGETGGANQAHEAEQWYRYFLAWFGDEPAATEMNFQLAELLYENGHYRLAWDEYERTAWSRGTHSRSVESALGAQHSSAKVLQTANAGEKSTLTERATAGGLRFVAAYPEHPAAPGLLVNSGTVLLEQQQYDRALDTSNQVLATATSSIALRQMAWSLRGQALFALEDYPGAAAAYSEAVQLANADDKRRPALQAGLASATYQQARQAFALGDEQSAADLYQQAAQLTPDPAIRSVAIFDAATTLLAIESWLQAIDLLQQFRNDFPDDPLQSEVTQKLAYAYERSGAHHKAAQEYQRLGQDQRQGQTLRREALLRAAELYRQTGATQQAISASERYLEQFPEPPAMAVIVMQQLADLELAEGDTQRRQYWLRAIIGLDRKAASASTAEPAAVAALELAEQQLAAFRRIELVAPVQEHLARKIAAMKQALQAFEAAIGYGIYPVTTAATYHIASMYDELGRALLTSERPDSLTVEERAEYDVLLAEQAAPFEQQAIAIYRSNVQRSGSARRDTWVEKSEQQLDELQGGK